ncbi:MAG TPA: hypothetical protein VGA56_06205, partial [Opitutaceae bacterium]
EHALDRLKGARRHQHGLVAAADHPLRAAPEVKFGEIGGFPALADHNQIGAGRRLLEVESAVIRRKPGGKHGIQAGDDPQSPPGCNPQNRPDVPSTRRLTVPSPRFRPRPAGRGVTSCRRRR